MKPGLLCVALVCGFAAGAWADPVLDRIAVERAAADARLAEQERECATRFIVAACVENARTEHRATLMRLRQQQLQIDEARRREAAIARRKILAERVAAQQAHASDAASEAPHVRVRRAPEPGPAIRHSDGAMPRPIAGGTAGADRAVTEQRNEEKFEARAREAQRHREEVQRRNAQREAQGKVAAPLPTPSGASAAR